jgi:ELWxxDGT repeat protein
LGDCLVFFAEIPVEYYGGYRGHTLWITDGTEAGTRLIAQVGQGSWNGSSTNLTPPFASVGTRCLLFSGSVDSRNSEPWITDGTPEGTGMLREIHPGEKGSDPESLTGTGGAVYFSADDGHHGRELWRSDGTPEGTVMVEDLTGDGGDSTPWGLFFTGGKLFFMARHGSRGTEPHVIDAP